jgi:hypothetical protein
VLTTVNASASHGVLLYALRKIITGLDSDDGNTRRHCLFTDAQQALSKGNIS